MSRRAALYSVTCCALVLVAAARAGATEELPLDASGLPAPAWQVDPDLATRWRTFTGRYIFQRACVSCHEFAPAHFSRPQWEDYLAGFPANHDPDVRAEYEDLTAQFLPGRMVPNADQQTDALSSFLLAAAGDEADPDAPEPWEGLPAVGDPAPDFTIVDLAGREHSLAGYRGEKRLVLVFSRAHW